MSAPKINKFIDLFIWPEKGDLIKEKIIFTRQEEKVSLRLKIPTILPFAFCKRKRNYDRDSEEGKYFQEEKVSLQVTVTTTTVVESLPYALLTFQKYFQILRIGVGEIVMVWWYQLTLS